ncbi:MAG TPA: methionyl-tRNA formyltransferase [Gammaproteobacteria bacterium]|nr:methionyl-tRNA formyltransferase [Gammaproteobacteria bacterium]
MDNNYLVCTVKSWNIEAFHALTPALPGNWHLFSDKDSLTLEKVRDINPRYVFFPHWSWIVPQEIVSDYACVCFHMTDVPYGRGGSPLQNLIARGHTDTQLTALRMVETLDAGPVYAKQPLSLDGSATEILTRAGQMSYAMMRDIVETQPTPTPQSGEPTVFKRRTTAMSEIPQDADSSQVYDTIRMLDAEGYPHAFIQHGEWTLSFTDATQHDNGDITATVRLTQEKPE